jgi:DNA (cytosine-5)-methyltransferase 1
MTVAGLFAGIGGIELGFKKAGFTIVWANEIDKNACKTYRLNHDHKLYECDIKELDEKEVEKVDVLTAGFPCQAFSIAGYQKGFQDDRGNVYFEILRFIDALEPKVVFLENVKNLKSHDKGNTYRVIKESLEERGYYIKDKVINSSDYVPQNRERIYIVAFKDKKAYEAFNFPKPKKVIKTIHDIIEKEAEERFYYTKSKYYPQLKQEMKNRDTIYQWRRVYVRENKSNLCPTLTANMGTGGHNVPLVIDSKDIRKLTPDECAKFQGFDELIFPDDMALSHRYKQIGNSVTVPVIEAIAKEILKALKCVYTLTNSKKTTTKKVA